MFIWPCYITSVVYVLRERGQNHLFFFSNCVLKKQEEKENEMKKNKKCVLTRYQFKDINMVCTLTPYQDMLVFSALKT